MLLSLLAYAALIIFIVGFAYRIYVYNRTPAPLKIPTTPAPLTKQGVAWRLFTEVAFFNSLFKSNKWTWLFGYAFHVALAVVTIRHLRYFFDLPQFFGPLQILGVLAGFVMVGALGMLFVRRLVVDRYRHISSKADYLMLVLLMAIGLSGLTMQFFARPDIVGIKDAMVTWTRFGGIFDIPGDPVFIMHFIGVLVLMLIFPFSKLMHAGGIFFSPTRNQTDTPREERHVNPWAKS
ncbi:respiratory nitrate reductase subunit gamma [Magnetofaba australis]|uniref:Putative nitrate reductase subunit gamma n=1 Tax=Magnetofaba australis IT-1 TaxID=1434232 RepID=A0A1Y2K011_9PROT|nr:respiratory nitrate reductase subunit gamma [Magnetofaba australis]OSM00429.1 putative nitrate reductase subunit gamma [Magnetofaba australis IT-1]